MKSWQSLTLSDSMDLSYFKPEPVVCGSDLMPETGALPKQSTKGSPFKAVAMLPSLFNHHFPQGRQGR
jgi:hypothetical protein